jgi:hypothetical protein
VLPRIDEIAQDVAAAENRITRARSRLQSLRNIRIGRLVVGWERPWRLDPVRAQLLDYVAPYDTVELTQVVQGSDAGMRIEQVLTIQGAVRLVVESRFYSYDFYRRAIAKFEEGLAAQRPT